MFFVLIQPSHRFQGLVETIIRQVHGMTEFIIQETEQQQDLYIGIQVQRDIGVYQQFLTGHVIFKVQHLVIPPVLISLTMFGIQEYVQLQPQLE